MSGRSTCWAATLRSMTRASFGRATRDTKLLEKHFGMGSSTKVLTKNGYPEDPEQGRQQADEVPLTAGEAKTYRMLAART